MQRKFNQLNMKKINIALLAIATFFCQQSIAQEKYSSRVNMEPGAVYEVEIDVKNLLAQQVNGMSFDFNLDGSATTHYTVTNVGDENISLRHKAQRITYTFDGMGAKMKFDSENKKDMEREFARPVRDMLAKSYDLIIDTLGKTLLVLAPTAAPSSGDDQFQIIGGMMGDLGSLGMPPQKGDPTLFMSWPGGDIAIGESWTISKNGQKETYQTIYTLASVTDSTYHISFSGTGTQKVESEMRGMPVTVNLKTATTGEITVDRSTGIVREKITTVESTGTSEMMGGSTPVSGKMTTKLAVRKRDP